MSLVTSTGQKLEKVLYTHNNGELSATLNDSVANYKYLIITLKNSNVSWEKTIIVDNPNGKKIPVSMPSFYFNDASNYGNTELFALLNISGNKITKERYGTLNNNNVATLNDYILIIKVIGWK